jgi:flap endonuclease-1
MQRAEGNLEAAYKYAQASSKLTRTLLRTPNISSILWASPGYRLHVKARRRLRIWFLKKMLTVLLPRTYDSFLFGAPTVVRNLAATGKTQAPPGKMCMFDVELEMIELEETLDSLESTETSLLI